jgi:nicotinamide mononucleotide transporter
VFFFVTNVIGWWRWANPKPHEEDLKHELKVSFMGTKKFLIVCGISFVGTFALGSIASNLHEWFPKVFPLPSAYPYVDSFIMVMSIITTFYMIEKKIESWIIWIIVDIIATWLYYVKGIKFYSAEYFIFTIIAGFGFWHWYNEYRGYQQQRS